MSDILLCTINSTYQHTAFGLRYIYANMGDLKSQTSIKEFVIKKDPSVIAQEILDLNPKILGFGVYIWNTIQTEKVIDIIKQNRPEIKIVLGGPEVSYEQQNQTITAKADFIVAGEADFAFKELCLKILEETTPVSKFHQADLPAIDQIVSPYYLYSDEDIKNRIVYVEASRGCPYKCEYCLSSLDKSVRNFPIEGFLADMKILIDRGARQFKFIDRTFNLKPSTSVAILNFFLSYITKQNLPLFLHFEMVPDRLPDELKEIITKFPKGSLQFEIGIQTWNSHVAALVSRKNDYAKTEENLKFLAEKTGVHTHVDLIFGLPGEDLQSFREGFNRLAKLEPDEIQVGILKRLKGTPIIRHDFHWSMKYSNVAPFQILENKLVDAETMEQMNRFAKFWDLIANRGYFNETCKLIRKNIYGSEDITMFDFYWQLSGQLWKRFQRSHSIPLLDLFREMKDFLIVNQGWCAELAIPVLAQDYSKINKLDLPSFLRSSEIGTNQIKVQTVSAETAKAYLPKRQNLHS